MPGEWGLGFKAGFWIVLALFWLTLWKQTRFITDHISQTNQSRFSLRKWLMPDRGVKKWVLISSGYLFVLAFPGVFGLLWIIFISLLVIICIAGLYIYVRPKLFKGWSLEKEGNETIVRIFIPGVDLDWAGKLYREWDKELGEVSYRRVLKGVMVGCGIIILLFIVLVVYYAVMDPKRGGAV